MSAQWTCETVNSDFDGTFKSAQTEENNHGALIMVEDVPIVIEEIIRYDTTIISSDTVFGYVYKLFVINDGKRLKLNCNPYIRKDSILESATLTEATDYCIVLSDTLYNDNFYKVMDIIITDFIVDSVVLSPRKYIKYPKLALAGSFFCDEHTDIDLIFVVNGIKKHYNIAAYLTSDHRLYIFYSDIWTKEFIDDFKKASNCKIRVNQSYCRDEYYIFNFTNSAKAYEFLTKID